MEDLAGWYLALLAFGLAGLLPAQLLFGRLWSAGVLYARPLAVAVVAYVTWTASAVVGLPYGTPLITAVLLGLFGWGATIAWRRPEAVRSLLARWRLIAAGEVVFLVLFAVLVLVRAQAPDAAFTEKPMDLMLLASVHDAERMPPEDAWFAGRTISYYHLGHVGVDAVARLGGVPTGVAFTLGVATAGALAGVAALGLAGDLSMLARAFQQRPALPWLAGGVAVVGLLWVSTLEGPLDLLAANGVGDPAWYARLGVAGLPPPEGATSGVPDGFWWWWRATRILPDMITEFPAFSILLGDLHAHVLALPLGVVATAVAVTAFDGSTQLTWRSWQRRPEALVLVAVLFAAMALTNTWDAAVFGALWLVAGVASFLAVGWPLLPAVFGMARHLLPPGVLALVLAWPFFSSLEAPPVGVGVVVGPASDPVRFALVWLPLAAPVLAAALLTRPRVERNLLRWCLGLAVAPVLLWTVGVAATGESGALSSRGAGWITLALLVLASGLGLAASLTAYREGDRSRAAWLGLAGAAAIVVLATELVYLDDDFGNRMNTVFKFWFSGWLLLAVAAGAAVADAAGSMAVDLAGGGSRRGLVWRVPLTTLLAAVFLLTLVYAPAAALSRGNEGQQRGLNSLAYLERIDPGVAAAIAWVRTNLGEHDVLLEAVGESYEQTNHVSRVTGVATVIAWPGHQRQWRSDEDTVGQRVLDVSIFYAAGASPEALEIARRYGVTHVFIGNEEERRYGPGVAARFASWPTVFEESGVRIVSVPTEGAP